IYSDRTFVVVAKKIGETNLVAVNRADKVVYRGTLLIGGGEIGRINVHSRKSLHEYTGYRCSEYNCQRFGDKYEQQPAPPVFVVPPAAGQTPAAPPPAE